MIKCLNTSLRKIRPSIRIESTASVTAWAEKGRGNGQWPSPGRFAAIIPKGFIPDLTDIRGMVDLPLWAMVGTKDSKPRVEGIQAMEKTLKELGSTGVKTTYFEGANHGSTPGEIKKLDGVYDWLFSHKLPR